MKRIHRNRRKAPLGAMGAGALLAVTLANGSCAPVLTYLGGAPATGRFAAEESRGTPRALTPLQAQALAPVLAQPESELAEGQQALLANAALPIAAGPNPAAASLAFSGPPVAQMRALDCLAQAIYYEARSESEEGQRAVAQVVLNRVRHPAWPNSVCGVVYQGPLRAGGGCQFTFTCDGSLRFRPAGSGWDRARRLAAEALAGRVYAPVGLSTFYHANYVMPSWAPRLAKVAQIGAHLFYRLPGNWGAPGAFNARYAGAEPIARPNPILVRSAAAAPPGTLPGWMQAAVQAQAGRSREPAAPAPEMVPDPVELQESQVRPEFRQSGQWRADAPAALRGD